MRTRLAIACIVATLLAVPGLASVSAAPAQYAPLPTATATLADSNPSDGQTVVGTARLKAFPNIKKILVEVRVTGLAPNSVHAWHIHRGTCQVEGPIVSAPPATKDLRANSQGVAFSSTLLADVPTGGSILTNGVPYYINVHARGSVNGVGGGITCGNLSTNGATTDFSTSLSGAEEFNATTGTLNAGDPDGTGSAFLVIGTTFVCYRLNVADILLPASAAHIHQGAAASNGGVVVGLAAPNAVGVATGCTAPVNPAITAAIKANPANYYVNVHNSVYPGGAVRGQLGD